MGTTYLSDLIDSVENILLETLTLSMFQVY